MMAAERRDDPTPPEEVSPDPEAMRDFDDVARITERFVHWAKWSLVVGLPLWLVLLVLVPRTGLGAIGSLSLATLITALVVVWAERVGGRLRGHRDGAVIPQEEGAPVRRRARGPMSATKAVLLTLAGVAVFAYLIFIIAIIVRGG